MVRETRNKVAFTICISRHLFKELEEFRKMAGMSRSEYVGYVLMTHFMTLKAIMQKARKEELATAQTS